ncbi:retrovirus-related Pol polyprotein from transposon 412 [Trichonephila clavipes]|nr:retrovirus-related Pol polyprotein from transposon 412 [Trichonephila clavipes]
MLKPYHQREENINLLCINPLKHDEEEDIPSLELENDRSGWSKIISDIYIYIYVQLKSKLSQIQRGQLKELSYEYSNLFSNIPGCTDLAEHDIELESERAIVSKPYRMSPRQIEILKSEVNPPTGQNGFFALLERLRKWTARIFLPSSIVFKSGLAAFF